MIVPIVFVIDFFLYIPIFIVLTNEYIAIVTVVYDHLVYPIMGCVYDCQLAVTARQTDHENNKECQHWQP
ncbi:MAG: hypothetical protein O3A57_07255 [Bacteroidetes bacterium]|nr:hypothetical protein [Bacteroidota bacterium]